MAATKKTEDNIYKQYTAPSSGGDYLKFEDGKEYKIRVASQPYVFLDTFTNKATGETRTSTKYALAIWNLTADAAQILQLPITGFRSLQAVAIDEDWGDPQSFNVNIKRTGTGTDTRYNIIPTPNRDPLDAEKLAAVEAIDVVAAIPNAIPMAQVVAGEDVPAPMTRAESDEDGPSPADREASGQGQYIDLEDIPF